MTAKHCLGFFRMLFRTHLILFLICWGWLPPRFAVWKRFRTTYLWVMQHTLHLRETLLTRRVGRDPILPTWMVHVCGFHEGKYASHMDGMGIIQLKCIKEIHLVRCFEHHIFCRGIRRFALYVANICWRDCSNGTVEVLKISDMLRLKLLCKNHQPHVYTSGMLRIPTCKTGPVHC